MVFFNFFKGKIPQNSSSSKREVHTYIRNALGIFFNTMISERGAQLVSDLGISETLVSVIEGPSR